MKLAISNIAFEAQHDEYFYTELQKRGFTGLKIAPTRIFPDSPYSELVRAKKFASDIKARYGLNIVSMQSIWYGRSERVFGSEEERAALIDYTERAVDFAESVGCKNLVFGCPQNRVIDSAEQYPIAVEFFRTLGDYAAEHGTVIAIEANPPIYNTNFINNDAEAMRLCRDVASGGFRINLDMGTMLYNDEQPEELDLSLISHVHLSEPGLGKIEKRELHRALSDKLKAERYSGYVSIEMKKGLENDEITEIMKYAGEVFNDL